MPSGVTAQSVAGNVQCSTRHPQRQTCRFQVLNVAGTVVASIPVGYRDAGARTRLCGLAAVRRQQVRRGNICCSGLQRPRWDREQPHRLAAREIGYSFRPPSICSPRRAPTTGPAACIQGKASMPPTNVDRSLQDGQEIPHVSARSHCTVLAICGAEA